MVKGLLRQASRYPSIGRRMAFFSQAFLGMPYLVDPLIGSATEPEVFTVTVAGFDCVTYQETVLALGWARTEPEFFRRLQDVRYRNGEIAWQRRLHYSTDWVRENVKRHFLKNLTLGDQTVVRTKRLTIVPGLSEKLARFRYFPKRRLRTASRLIEDGDMIFFVSTRPGIDVFHTGIVFRGNGGNGGNGGNDGPLLRHAARSRGGVVEQPLEEFFANNRMSGFILARPVERASS
jgi:N-acetylmuramoyl-L-alanine amidase-like